MLSGSDSKIHTKTKDKLSIQKHSNYRNKQSTSSQTGNNVDWKDVNKNSDKDFYQVGNVRKDIIKVFFDSDELFNEPEESKNII